MNVFLTTLIDVQLEEVECHLWQPGDVVSGSSRAVSTLWLVLEGSLEITAAAKRWIVPAGAVLLLPRNVPHDVATIQGARWLSVGLLATLFGRSDLLQALNSPVLSSPDEQRCRALQFCAEMVVALRQDGPLTAGPTALISKGLAYTLFGLCWQILGYGDLTKAVPHQMPEWLPGTLERICREPSIHLDELSRSIGVSPAQMRRVFHRSLGVSPQAYLTRVRLEEACHLLRTTDLRIGAVANQVGFDSLPYFSLLFKRIYGQTPIQYRQDASQSSRHEMSLVSSSNE